MFEKDREILELERLPSAITPINAGPATRSRVPVLAGLAMIILFAGGFCVWAATAPIGGAVIAVGSMVSRGQNKIIQHLEGGIVKKIHVREGDTVKAGAPILELDPTLAMASLGRLSSDLDIYLAKEARLLAERDGLAGVTFSPRLQAASGDSRIARIIKDQEIEFSASLNRFEAEVGILEQKAKALKLQIEGLAVQRKWTARQLELTREEIIVSDDLFKKQLITRDKVLAAKRREAELEGGDGDFLSRIGRAEEEIILSTAERFPASVAE